MDLAAMAVLVVPATVPVLDLAAMVSEALVALFQQSLFSHQPVAQALVPALAQAWALATVLVAQKLVVLELVATGTEVVA